jgi:importin subunit beta-1
MRSSSISVCLPQGIMQAVDITAVLQSAQSPDAVLRNEAESQLKAFEQQNYAGYLFSLASELANEGKPADSRQIAGLIIKNTLDATDDVKKVALGCGLDACKHLRC